MASTNFEKYKSDGSLQGNLLEWVDALPRHGNVEGHFSEYYAPKTSTSGISSVRWRCWCLSSSSLPASSSMHLKPDAALNASLASRLPCLGRIHHARCALGLGHPLHALDGRLGVLHRPSAHVPRPDVRLVPASPRTDLAVRRRHLPRA